MTTSLSGSTWFRQSQGFQNPLASLALVQAIQMNAGDALVDQFTALGGREFDADLVLGGLVVFDRFEVRGQ